VDGTGSSDPDGTIASYAWDFGDGFLTTGATPPAHTYVIAGKRTVTLTVTDNLGATGASTKVNLGPNDPPTPVFAVPVCTGRACLVDANGSTDPDGTVASYRWNFGDGTPAVSGPATTAAHTYAADGPYTITLTVTDNLGATSTATRSVSVVKAIPTAAFSLACTGRVCTVDGSASSSPDDTITSYAWDFGDGTPVATTVTPTTSHAYTADGSYPVTLTVTDGGGAVSAPSAPTTAVVVTRGPTAALLTPSCVLTSCAFDASGSTAGGGAITGYSWNFGDGTPVVSGPSPTASHAYATDGPFTVTVTVTDANALTDSTTRTATPTRTLASDTFGRTVTAGWGAADVGGPWSILYTASNYAVSAGTAKVTVAATATRSAWLPATSGTDAVVKVDAAVSKLPSAGQAVWFYAAARRIDENTSYRARVRVFTDGSVRLAVVARLGNGTDVVIGTEKVVSGLTVTAGQRLSLRFQATGTTPTTLKARVWLATSAEPVAWQIEAIDSAALLQAPGAVGLSGYTPSANTAVPVDVTFSGFLARTTL
jgi:PKD repeat protein